MATNPFPPQAYTRETMIKAFEWLQSQSPQVRELASTTDLLMSLYNKAMIQGKDALERPQLANFKNELRNLAGQLGEFDTTAQDTAFHAQQMPAHASPPPSHASATAHSGQGHPNISTSFHGVQHGAYPSQQSISTPNGAYVGGSIPSSPGSVRAAAGTQKVSVGTGSFVLDSKSQEWLEEIQRELNLESPAEALRLAISVGYSRLSELFPKRR